MQHKILKNKKGLNYQIHQKQPEFMNPKHRHMFIIQDGKMATCMNIHVLLRERKLLNRLHW
jgi:hypothetical protein